jgi:hypothetical protein
MHTKDEVLAALGHVPDLARLIPAAFLQRFHLAEPMQYGMVCRDVSHRIEELEKLGAGPFLHVTTRPPGWKESGVARRARVEIALGYCAGQQLELLGPGENTDFYREKIPADGGFALHHVGIAQLGLGASRRAFADAGIPAVVEMGIRLGPFYSVDVAYTRDELGFYVELLEFRTLARHTPPSEKLVSSLARLQRRFRRSQQ